MYLRLDVQKYLRQYNLRKIFGKIGLVGMLSLLLAGVIFSLNVAQAQANPHMSPNANQAADQLSADEVGMIYQIFGSSYGAGAVRVAMCESGLNSTAYNPMSIMGSHAMGLFQILYPSTWESTSQAGSSPYSARANIRAAHEIFVRDGYSWREWMCRP